VREKEPEIIAVKPVYHYALKGYLKGRGVNTEIATRYLRKIKYKVGDKEYFAWALKTGQGVGN
jgi:predicted solute-binding protein